MTRCAHCGIEMSGRYAYPAFCTPECSDAWYDAHPDDKERAKYLTRQDVIDRVLARMGMIPMPRGTKPRGDN